MGELQCWGLVPGTVLFLEGDTAVMPSVKHVGIEVIGVFLDQHF